MSTIKPDDPAAWLEGIIQDFLTHSPENTLQNEAHEKSFEKALVGL